GEAAQVSHEPAQKLRPAQSGHERPGQHTQEQGTGTEEHSEAADRGGPATPNVQGDVGADDHEEFAAPNEHQAPLTALRGESLQHRDRALRRQPEVQTLEERLHFAALLRAQQEIAAFDYVHKDTERQECVEPDHAYLRLRFNVTASASARVAGMAGKAS